MSIQNLKHKKQLKISEKTVQSQKTQPVMQIFNQASDSIRFRYKLLNLLIPAAISVMTLAGCGGGSGADSSTPNPPSPKAGITINTPLPETELVQSEAILSVAVHNDDARANALYSQKNKAFSLASGREALHVERINFPHTEAMHYKVANVDDKNSCCHSADGSHCNVTIEAGDSCQLLVNIFSEKPQLVDNQIGIVTGAQTYFVPLKVNYLTNDSSDHFPQPTIDDQITIVPGSKVQISITNTDRHQAINYLQVHLPSWLAQIAKNAQLTRIANLAPGQTQIFSFDLASDQTTVDALNANLSVLNTNPASHQISISASDVKTMYPDIFAAADPVTVDGDIDFSKAAKQQVNVINHADGAVKISSIQTTLPKGVTIDSKDSSCQQGGKIAAHSQCQLMLEAAVDAAGQGQASLGLELNDYAFSKDVSIQVAKTMIQTDTTKINIPAAGSAQTTMKITNTGAFSWQPSAQMSDYIITENAASKVSPRGLSIVSSKSTNDCLSGNPVLPGKSCNLTFNAESTLKNRIYNFTIKAVNNLAKDVTTILSTTGVHAYFDPSYDMYQGVKRIALLNDSQSEMDFTTNALTAFSIYNGKNADTDKGEWCTSTTCPNSCVSDEANPNSYDLKPAASCYLYLHNNAQALDSTVGKTTSETLSITTKMANFGFALLDRAVLYAGGTFTTAGQGGLVLNNVAMWNGQQWQALAQGVDNSVNAIKVAADGNVYIGGKFTHFNKGKVVANLVGQWNGKQWQALNSGWQDVAGDDQIFAMDFTPNGSLFVGGKFNVTDHGALSNIAMWQNNTWLPLQNGLNGPVHNISSLGKFRVDSGTIAADAIAIGGDFSQSLGTYKSTNMDLWYQGKFNTAGTGVRIIDGKVNAIMPIWKNDTLKLVVGGEFSGVENVANTNYIFGIKKDAYSMTKDAASLASIYALATDQQQNIYVGGDFINFDDQALNHIAVIQDSAWHPLGSGVDGQVDAIIPQNNLDNTKSVYVGGKFKDAGDVASQGVALWNGETKQWQTLAGGVSGSVNALAYGDLVTVRPLLSD